MRNQLLMVGVLSIGASLYAQTPAPSPASAASSVAGDKKVVTSKGKKITKSESADEGEDHSGDEDEVAKKNKKVKYPQICGWLGKIEFVSPSVPPNSMKKKAVVREKADIKTPAGGLFCLDLSETDRIVVGPDSWVQLPGIEIETGQAKDIVLQKGEMRAVLEYREFPIGRTVSSKIYRQKISQGDFVFKYNPATGLGGVMSLDGELQFQPLESEVLMAVKSGESVDFQSEIKDGEVQYDQLLQGKKVVRGTLQPKQSVKPDQLDKVRQAYAAFDISLMRKKAMAIIAQKKIVAKNPKAICFKPEGEFNQCSYTCEGNPKKAKKCEIEKPGVKCIRQRCDANGHWTDRYELPKNLSTCKAQTKIAVCE